MRELDLHLAPKGHARYPEVVDAIRIEDRTPAEELLCLADQKIDDRRFEQNVTLAHAKRAPREKAALAAAGRIRRRGALEVPLEPRRSRDGMPRGCLHTEAENRIACRHREAAVLAVVRLACLRKGRRPRPGDRVVALPVLERLRRI